MGMSWLRCLFRRESQVYTTAADYRLVGRSLCVGTEHPGQGAELSIVPGANFNSGPNTDFGLEKTQLCHITAQHTADRQTGSERWG